MRIFVQFINSATAFEDMAQAVLSRVEPIFKDIETMEDARVQAYSRFLVLSSKVPDVCDAQKIVEDAKKYCGIDGQAWLKEVECLRDRGILFQEERLELQYFCIGDWCLCGIPNETMTEFALETEKVIGNPYFYFNGYTNGCSSYFPTKEEYDQGGYEVYWAMLLYFRDYGRVYPYEREAMDIVVRFAAEQYSEM